MAMFSRGRAASEIRTGLFIRDYLEQHREACIVEMHRALKAAWAEINLRRRRENRYKPPTYESFGKYFRHFVALGMVEFSRESDMEYPPSGGDLLSIRDGKVVKSRRRFYRMTPRGHTEEVAWLDPVKALNPIYRQ